MFQNCSNMPYSAIKCVYSCMIPLALLAAASLPNIVFIMCDDMGYGDLACYGQPYINTPNIDRMAREGVRFTQAYCGSPVSAPSRASLMTGQHTGHTHVRGNKEYWKNSPKVRYGENVDYGVVGQEPYDPPEADNSRTPEGKGVHHRPFRQMGRRIRGKRLHPRQERDRRVLRIHMPVPGAPLLPQFPEPLQQIQRR